MSNGNQESSGAPAPAASIASDAAVAAAANPARLVTRAETIEVDEGASPASALVDYLAFTLQPPLDLAFIERSLEIVFNVARAEWRNRGRGWNGYTQRIDLADCGWLAFGGESQRGTINVQLTGTGCARIEDWKAVRIWGETYGATITRCDLAHDDYEAKILSVDRAVEWLDQGLFNSGGREPKTTVAGDWIRKIDGRTLYVGTREGGKYLRVYEKGKQLGNVFSEWTRAEVELHNEGRIVPWDVVTQPGRYLAGAYPAFRYLSTEQSRLRTTQRAASISYEAMVRHLRVQGGKSLNVMCEAHGNNADAVLLQLVREGVPKRLSGYPECVRRSVLDSNT